MFYEIRHITFNDSHTQYIYYCIDNYCCETHSLTQLKK